MTYLELRKQYGDPFIQGIGIEIGAGLRPVRHDGIEKLYFFDKRNPEEFEAYFGAPPEYDLISLDGVRRDYPNGLDFISSHHVIEHIDNPIGVLVEWIGMLKEGGVFYFSVPSQNNTTEVNRLHTPIRHILEDHYFQRDSASYDSKQHLYSFVEACAASAGELTPWFSKDGVVKHSQYLLYDIYNRDDHDSHWHTMDLSTTRQLAEIAFHLSGAGGDVLVCEESDDSHYLLIRKTAKGEPPVALRSFHEAISSAAEMVRQGL